VPTQAVRLDLGQLEDRVLFSAVPLPPDLINASGEPMEPDLPDILPDDTDGEWRSVTATIGLNAGNAWPEIQPSKPLELLLIDDRVDNLELLLRGLTEEESSTSMLVFTLDAERDGVTQISEILAQFQDVSRVHLISHGQDAELLLGNRWLNAGSLAEYEQQIQSWGKSFAADGELLLYACELAASSNGQSLVRTLAEWTSVSVAASTDLTGASWLGGDWSLEYTTGDVARSLDHFADDVLAWDGLLATFTVTTPADGGVGSLRQAILDANANPGVDTIQLAAGRYLLLIVGAGEDAGATGDLDITDDVILVGQGADRTMIDGAFLDRILEVHSGQVSLHDLALIHGSADDGGAILNHAQLHLENVLLRDNVATGQGGGLFNDGTLTIQGSTLASNRATDGGGVYASGSVGGTLDLRNSTVVSNIASGRGGGVFTDGSGIIHHVTIAYNEASQGGGLFSSSAMDLSLSLIAHNHAAAGGNVSGTFHSLGGNLFESGDGATGFDVSDIVGGTVGLDTELRYNGGPTPTLALAADSSARNLGSALASIDQRGELRDTQPDAGAFEAMVGPVIVTTTSDVVDGNVSSITALQSSPGSDGAISLREAIVAANATAGNVEIVLPSGVYFLSAIGQHENVGLTGDLDITGNIRLLGAGVATTLVDGLRLDRVFHVLAGSLAVEGLTIQNGWTQQLGGGIRVEAGSVATLTNLMVLDNRAGRGGGIANSGDLTLHRVTVANNTSDSDGGGIATDGAAAQLALTNVTVSGNDARQGGGISLNSDATLAFATVAYNVADTGGGVYLMSNQLSVQITNSILANNSGQNASGSLQSAGGNLDSDGSAALGTASDRVADPLLHAELSDQGGGLLVHTLAATSPAIDAALASAIQVDQSGESRAWDGNNDGSVVADIGAWEYLPGQAVAPTLVWDPWIVFESGDAAQPLSPSAEFIHPDEVDWNGATIQVALTGSPATGEDEMFVAHQGNGQGNIAVSGNNLSYSNTQIGTMVTTVTATGVQVTITLNHQATNEAVQAVLRQFRYDNSAAFVSPGERQVRVNLLSANGVMTERSSRLFVTSGGIAVDDVYNLDEDTILQMASPGFLANDRFGAMLLYDAALDGDGDGEWEDANLTGFVWDLDAIGVTRVLNPLTSLPGIAAAYSFNGTGGAEMMSLENLPGAVDQGSASFEFWVNPSDATGTEVIFESGGLLNGVSFVFQGGTLRFTITEDIIPRQLSADVSAKMLAEEFIHIVGVIDRVGNGSNLYLYVDGSLVDSGTDSFLNDWSNSGDAGLGRAEGFVAGGYSGNFVGEIAQFRFYDYALTNIEVVRNSDAVTAFGETPQLVALIPDGADSELFFNLPGNGLINPTEVYQRLLASQNATESFRYVVEYGGRWDIGEVQLSIQGRNDAPSGILLSNYHIPEQDRGATVGTLFAIDPDQGDSHSFSTSDSRFRITGGNVLRLAGNFEADFEAGPTITVDVMVTDSAGSGFLQTITLFVDSQNEPPQLTSDSEPEVSEGTNAGILVTASDPDGDLVTIQISSGPDSSRFTWDPVAQRLYFVSLPDYEQPLDANGDNRYEVTLRLSDDSGGETYQSILVTIQPVNEHDPVFVTPGDFAVHSGERLVGILQATDADLPQPSIRYSITGGADASAFQINSTTGRLVFRNTPNHAAPADTDGDNVYQVRVRASDQQGRSTLQDIEVRVVLPNNPPVTQADQFEIEAGNLLVVAAPGLLDNDSDPEGSTLTASLVSGPAFGTLTLQPNGGFTYLADKNSIGAIQFTYAAEDLQGNRTHQIVTVAVIAPLSAQDLSAAQDASSSGSSSLSASNTAPGATSNERTDTDGDNSSSTTPTNDGKGASLSPVAAPSGADLLMMRRADVEDRMVANHPTLTELLASSPLLQSPSANGALDGDPSGADPNEIMLMSDGSSFEIQRHGFHELFALTSPTLDLVEAWVPPATSGFWREMSSVQEQMAPEIRFTELQVSAATSVVGSFSLGYVVWMLRAGSLITTVMTQLPAWTMIDPLPVLQFASGDRGNRGEDDSLESLIRQSNTQTRRAVPAWEASDEADPGPDDTVIRDVSDEVLPANSH
jgi:hypothetical protein